MRGLRCKLRKCRTKTSYNDEYRGEIHKAVGSANRSRLSLAFCASRLRCADEGAIKSLSNVLKRRKKLSHRTDGEDEFERGYDERKHHKRALIAALSARKNAEAEEKGSKSDKKKQKKLDGDIAELKKQIEAKDAEISEQNDRYMRMLAEYDNFRKRTAKERKPFTTMRTERHLKLSCRSLTILKEPLVLLLLVGLYKLVY